MKPLDAGQVMKEEASVIAARQVKVLGATGKPLLGLAISGGGIRTATLNLGIVQGLTKSGLLPRVDYLSTVSGGGYVGTWLHGVIRRFGKGDPASPELARLLTRPETNPHTEAHDDPVAFLRKYSSYLAPTMGLFSADFWVIVGIWLRNILLNQLIILPFFAAVSLLPFALGSFAGWRVNNESTLTAEIIVAVLAIFGLAWCAGSGVGSVALDSLKREPDGSIRSRKHGHGKWDSSGTAITSCILMLVGSFALSLLSDSLDNTQKMLMPRRYIPLILGVFLSAMFWFLQLKGKFSECFESRHGHKPRFGTWAYPILAGFPTGGLFYAVMSIVVNMDTATSGVWNTVAWGTPLLSFAMITGAALHIGLMGVDYDDNAREWLARLGAYATLFAFGWAALFALAIFVPYWLTQLAVASWAPVAGLGGGWVATSIAGAFTGNSSKTAGSTEGKPSGGILALVSAIAPTVFIIGYLVLISFGLHLAIARLSGITTPLASVVVPRQVNLQVSSDPVTGQSMRVSVNDTSKKGPPPLVLAIAGTERKLLEEHKLFLAELLITLGLLSVASVLIWYLPRRVDINEFSMQHFYKNRLVRCYLGATKGAARRPSRFTGFDPADDMPLADLLPDQNYYGPFALVNTCINLNRGSELAKLERKGSAFLFSPLYSGYDPPHSEQDLQSMERGGPMESGMLHANGYRLTKGFGYPAGYMIGTCMGISGAAASPNGGYHTSGPMAFLMTLFCVRMGWWVGNTRRHLPSTQPGPSHSLLALLAELFAFTDARSNFVNLSDGGHFENLALYELVRRRCRYIIAGDGEEDGRYTFESLGGAIRKCRTDFGAEITINPRPIHPIDGLSKRHCVVGRIRYAGETEPTGWLLYLKSSLTGDEPQDVAQYKSSYPEFPQQPTANQFFTESQFESYRKLGLHIWESAVEGLPVPSLADDPELFFVRLQEKWGDHVPDSLAV
jgi:hypothetical protein